MLSFSGRYNLSDSSFLELTSNKLKTTEEEVNAILDFMKVKVQKTPNPRNPRTFLKRKQCTFVLPGITDYEFGQHNDTFRSESDEWPAIVKHALKVVHRYAERNGIDPDLYNGVHAVFYENGLVGLNPHADKEDSMLEGMPIFSFTLLKDASKPRAFSIYKWNNEKLFDVMLQHGDMLVMGGKMQKQFKHGVEKARPPRLYKNAPRINLTVRAFQKRQK